MAVAIDTWLCLAIFKSSVHGWSSCIPAQLDTCNLAVKGKKKINKIDMHGHWYCFTSLLASSLAKPLNCWFSKPEGLGISGSRFSTLRTLAIPCDHHGVNLQW